MRPILGSRAFIPTHLLDAEKLLWLRRELTFVNPARNILTGEDETVSVHEFREVTGGVSIPRAFALRHFEKLDWNDQTYSPHSGAMKPVSILPRDEKQAKFFHTLQSIAKEPGGQDALANATTGAGKTVTGLYLASTTMTPTLIIVDSNKIAAGWIKESKKFFGDSWTDKYVGRVQQDFVSYEDKLITITLAQSLVSRRYHPSFYTYFGLVILDEIQVFGSPSFSRVFSMFPARLRYGFTAENKTGAYGRVIKAHIGDTKAVSKQEVLKPHAWSLTFKHEDNRSFWNDPAVIQYLAHHDERNAKLARLIDERGYQRGRNVLAFSERTAHLWVIKKLLIARGLPADVIGIHAGSYQTDRYVVSYSYSEEGSKHKIVVLDTENEAKAAIRKLKQGKPVDGIELPSALMKHIANGKLVIFSCHTETYVPDENELDNITNTCQIILATYKIFEKGINVQRLDTGVELSPWGNIKQALGRILRIAKGKPTPEWYAVNDVVETDNPFGVTKAKALADLCEARTKARMRALRLAGATVKRQ
jgi:hypothetical protein